MSRVRPLWRTLIDALADLPLNDKQTTAYFARFKYAIFGKPVRGSMYPPRKVFYLKDGAHYLNDGHGHAVQVAGKAEILNGFIHHDDRKSFSHWLTSQDRYLQKEAEKLTEMPFNQLKWTDKLRWFIVPAPFFALIYCLILRGGMFDGKRGWHYAMQRVLAEIILSIRLTETRLTK